MDSSGGVNRGLSPQMFALGLGHTVDAVFLEILNRIHESILIIDADTRVCFVNDSYLQMFGIKREKIVGRLLADFEPLARIRDVLRTREPAIGDISYIQSAKMNVIADISPLFCGDTLIGAVALMKNVTELIDTRKELEHFRNLTQYLQDERNSRDNLPEPFQNVYGQSASMIRVLRIAAKAAKSSASICITGESGTGKEVMANAIHESSKYAEGPFIKINCAAIPENLLESELFGYESGAFTGARQGGKAGKFELASGGSIFLDEIGEMPLSMQVKLLRALQEREITRVGGTRPIKLNFRLITATNRDLKTMVTEGNFREDLYYRINVINLHIPPLRERPEDVVLYSHLFLEELSRQYNTHYAFTQNALDAIRAYPWPGNVRELKNCIERAAVLSTDGNIGPEFLPVSLMGEVADPSPESFKLRGLLEKTEREAISAVLRLTNNNRTQAINWLGISRRSFYQKLEKYDLI